MTMLAGQNDGVRSDWPSLTGRFWAQVWDLDCVLELRVDEAGCLQGSFDADGQRLEVSAGPPDASGQVSGLICSANLSEPFASFRLRQGFDGLLLEVRATGDTDSLERVQFVRLT